MVVSGKKENQKVHALNSFDILKYIFRGVEHMYQKYFKQYDIETRVGYMGGDDKHADYRSVCIT